ncbi:DUF2459 domain-containing protein [Polaribacter vadi]|uniref:DUF2459 domain-containing protein n=1 Tax=Polaribacter TaxID=52959 RepID=UPI001C096A71|nr:MULTISPECIES: DUF2459 domain-containing protein [Polaribacter]MBU3010067.1 DUF2459 domain-containing protein [Polaribacter vadi]MDO6739874.1 DUF2459 domain-containing protein [Polaribacter sp. 1_MG-2023]
MRIGKRIIKWFLYFLLIPITYILISLILSSITVDKIVTNESSEKLIYLSTNGVHLDIILPIENVDSFVLSGLKYNKNEKYLSFGWGDENFYINTPTWDDLTFKNAFSAVFLKSSTLIHITRYKHKYADWVAIKVNDSELKKLNNYLLNTFKTDEKEMKIILKNQSYSSTDNFYKSKGSYSAFKTCNTWVNTAFKKSGLKSALWTPFDFGLINKYK